MRIKKCPKKWKKSKSVHNFMLLIKTHYVMVIFHLLIGPKLKEEGGRQDSAKAKSYAPVDYGAVKKSYVFNVLVHC